MSAHTDGSPIHVSGLDDSLDALIKHFPESLFGAPDEPLLLADFSRDPYPALADLKAREGDVVRRGPDGTFGGVTILDPFGHDASKPAFVALSHSAVQDVATHADRFKSHDAYAVAQAIQGPTLNCRDGAEHRSMRRLMDQTIFGRKQMQEYLLALTQPIADFVVDRIENRLNRGEAVELCRDLALPLVYKSISTIIGVPTRFLPEFINLGDDSFGFLRDPRRAMEAVGELASAFNSELQQHKTMENPPRDFMTIMLESEHNGYRLSEEEIVMHCRFLLPGGIETTWRQTANLMMAMMLHPEQWKAVTDDASLVDQAVEEALRWCPSGWVAPRLATGDTEVGGVSIPAGSSVNNLLGLANRDPAVWERPDEFDIFRDKRQHVTFQYWSSLLHGAKPCTQHLVDKSQRDDAPSPEPGVGM